MLSFNKYITETVINEAFQSNMLRGLDAQIKDAKKNWSYFRVNSFRELMRYYAVAWDKVNDSDFKEYKVGDDAKKMINDFVKGKVSGLLFGKKGDDFVYFCDSMLRTAKFAPNHIYLDNLRDFERGGRKMAPQYMYKDALNHEGDVDTILLLKFDALKYTERAVYQLRTQRAHAKDGVIPVGDPNYYKKVAADNVKRYKDIIAKHKVENMTENMKKLSEDVKNIIDQAMDLSTKVLTEPDKYAVARFEIGWVDEYIYKTSSYDRGRVSGFDGLLPLFKSYVDKVLTLSKQDSYNPDSAVKGLEKIEADIRKYIDVVKSKIDKVNEVVSKSSDKE